MAVLDQTGYNQLNNCWNEVEHSPALYLCIYVCMCVCIHAYMHTCIYPSIHPSIYLPIYLTNGLTTKFSGARTRRFITAFTTARHRTLFWARWIHSTTSQPISLRSILFHSPTYAVVFQVVSFFRASPPKPCTRFFTLPCVSHAPPTSFFFI
jgi:hypothetical protein